MNNAADLDRRCCGEAECCARRQARLPQRARAQDAVAVDLDDPQRQPSAAEPRRAQSRRPSGVERIGRDLDDRALFRRAAAAGSGRGQAARLAGLSRDPIPARPSDARKARAVSRVRRRPILSVAHQGRRHRRLLDRVGRARRRHDVVQFDRAGLSAPEGPHTDRRPAGPHDCARRRCRTRRGQHLRGVARRLETRCSQSVVGHRLQPPEPRCGGLRSALRPHRRDVRDDGLAGRHPEIRAAVGSRLRPTRRPSTARMDRRLPELALFGARLQGRRRAGASTCSATSTAIPASAQSSTITTTPNCSG